MSELKTGHGHCKACYQLKSITNTKAVEPMSTKKRLKIAMVFLPLSPAAS